MISGCFLLKKMIYSCEKSFTSSSEMINCTRKWFRRSPKMISVEMIYVSFDASFEGLICSCKKKTFTTEMIISGNGRKSFLSRKCPVISSLSFAFSVLSTGALHLLPISILGASAGTIRAVPDTVKKVPGLAPVLFSIWNIDNFF